MSRRRALGHQSCMNTYRAAATVSINIYLSFFGPGNINNEISPRESKGIIPTISVHIYYYGGYNRGACLLIPPHPRLI